tara:strand:- start:661 stop:879 length:219 start_codon:yes stop_codon:yes gene_type:complete
VFLKERGMTDWEALYCLSEWARCADETFRSMERISKAEKHLESRLARITELETELADERKHNRAFNKMGEDA